MSARSAAVKMGTRLAVRDTERFKLLFTNSRPRVPGGKLATVVVRTTRALIGERLQALKASLARKN
jgi:hypothetical protein